jgi:hypothetical protein
MTDKERKAKEAEAFSWEEWIREGIRGMKRLTSELGVPEEFWEHTCAAQREALLACGVLMRGVAERLNSLAQRFTEGKKKTPRPAEPIEVK